MAKVEIIIHTGNAAFEDNPGELSRILQQIAETCDDGIIVKHILFDVNGNAVGSVKVDR